VQHKAAFVCLQLNRLQEVAHNSLSRQELIICMSLEWNLKGELDIDWWWYEFEVTPNASLLSNLQ